MAAPTHIDQPAIGTPVRRLPPRRRSPLRGSDVVAGGGFVVAVTAGLWARNGGLSDLLAGGSATLGALARLGGLTAALAAMAAIVLTARPAWLERAFGLDSLLAAHRWLGITTVTALVAHVVLDTWARAATMQQGAVTAFASLLEGQAWMIAALVSGILFLIIGLTSWRLLRRRMSYETWYFLHTLGYLAVLLGFGHQITLGTDISTDRLTGLWWAVLAVATAVNVLWARLGAIVGSARNSLRVRRVTRETPTTASLQLDGPNLRRLRVSSGQFFLLRPLTRGLWWQAHPFSVSAAPTDAGLRFTVKELGDDTPAIASLRPGTRVLLEGPYGTFTLDQARGRKVVMVAGGVGVAPIRALLEDCHPAQEPIVIVRVHDAADLAHRTELEALVAQRNGQLHVLAGPRRLFASADPFGARTLAAWIPDIAERHAFVCGPASLESVVIRGVRGAGMPARHIHHERFGV